MKKCLSSAFLKTIAILLLFASLLLFAGNVGSLVLVGYLEETYGGKEEALHEAWTRIFFHKVYNLTANYTIYGDDPDTLEDSLSYAVFTTNEGKYEEIDFSDCYYLYQSDDFSSEKESLMFALTRIEILDGITAEEASSDNYWSGNYVYFYYEQTLFPMLFNITSFSSDNAEIYLYRSNHSSIFEFYTYDYSSYDYSSYNYSYSFDPVDTGSGGTTYYQDDGELDESTSTEIASAAEITGAEITGAESSGSTGHKEEKDYSAESAMESEDTDGTAADTTSSGTTAADADSSSVISSDQTTSGSSSSDTTSANTDSSDTDSSILYYWVVGSVRTDYVDSFNEFSMSASLLNRMWSFSVSYMLWFAICISVGLLCTVYLCLAAGHRHKKDGIALTWVDKMPYAILLAITGAIALVLSILSVNGFIYNFLYYSQSYLETILSILAAILLFFIVYLFLCLLTASTIVRLKAKSFWRYTLTGFLVHLVRHLWRKTSVNLKELPSHLPLACTVSIAFVLLTAADFIILALSGMTWFYLNPVFLFVYLILKAIELLVLIFMGLQADRIRKGGQRIAAGDLSEPIPTNGLFGEFRRHAENINKVGDCISTAVEDRMKSEHFRTELITNVSHDIKTPLTSIINYVDLMKKEDITDPTLLEYMDVLDRQSARLKKLIDDLMEASKASTGNLEVHLENCNISVLFSQIIGEFDDRAAAKNLNFVENLPKEPVYIMADGRHLWRVLENLLNNACKYSVPGTRIYIDLTVSDINYAVISIKNISKAQLNISSEELLERFVRGDSSRNTEGSGLGLSIAQSLTELMHGHLHLEIDGDLFKVILEFPCTEPPEDLTDSETESAAELPEISDSLSMTDTSYETVPGTTPGGSDNGEP